MIFVATMHRSPAGRVFKRTFNWSGPGDCRSYPTEIMLQTPSFIFACCLCAIAVVGLTRSFDTAPPQVIGLTIAGGTLSILGLKKFNREFREAINAIAIEQLICWHSIRAPIGAAFLVMANEGLLPEMFAKRAGYGDMLTAFLGIIAIVVCATIASQESKVAIYLAWNILGLVDLILAVGTGIFLAFQIPNSMIWIARLPLLLVPAFILPVLFATHFIMLGRLLGRTPETSQMQENESVARSR